MKKIKSILTITASIVMLSLLGGCDIEGGFRKNTGTAPTPTPTKTLYAWATATPEPTRKVTHTPTIAPDTPNVTPITIPTRTPGITYPTVTPYPTSEVTKAPVVTSVVTPTSQIIATPTAGITVSPTRKPTKAPTPTESPNTPASLIASLTNALTNKMYSTDIFIDILHTDENDCSENMYYTNYTYADTYDNVTHLKTDTYTDVGDTHTYECKTTYVVTENNGYTIYENYEDDPDAWNKRTQTGTYTGITYFSELGEIKLSNATLVSASPDSGYEITADCKIDLNPVITMLSSAEASSNFKTTFTLTAYFDYETFTPTGITISEENKKLSSAFMLNSLWVNVYDISDGVTEILVPDEVYAASDY